MASGSALASSPTIDAGIVLADRAGYYCLPLEQAGLPPDAQIVSLESSCDCVQPRLVQYVADRQRYCQTILLERVHELSPAEVYREDSVNEIQSATSGAIVEVGLADAQKPDFTVNLLHAVLYQEEHAASAYHDRSINPWLDSILPEGGAMWGIPVADYSSSHASLAVYPDLDEGLIHGCGLQSEATEALSDLVLQRHVPINSTTTRTSIAVAATTPGASNRHLAL